MENNDRKNGLKALKTVEEFIIKIGWQPQKTSIDEVLLVDFESEGIPISNVLFDVRVDYERFLCYFNFKDTVSKKKQLQVIEFITRANFDLVIGNFELDMDSGIVRFKSSIDFTGIELNQTLIRNTVKSAMDVVEDYAEAMVKVLTGKIKARNAIQEIENGDGHLYEKFDI